MRHVDVGALLPQRAPGGDDQVLPPREHLLHPGEAVGATRARYDDSHVRRLRLVRALTDVAGLRLDDVRQVLAAIEDTDLSRHEAIGSAHSACRRPPQDRTARRKQARVASLLERHGWELAEQSTHRAALAAALSSLAALGHPPSDDVLDVYADAAELISEHDLASLRRTGPRRPSDAVVSTLLLEPVLLTLRRIAQENASRRRGR